MNPKTTTVAHVVLGLRVGGLERVVANLATGLSRRDYRVLIVCLEERGEFADALETAQPRGISVRVLRKKAGVDWNAVWRLAGVFRKENVTIVHSHNPAPHFYGVLAGLLARVPVRIHTKHGRNYPDDRRQVLINRILSMLCDAVVPVSDDACSVALRVEGVLPHKVHRIWNGVDTDLYKPNPSVAMVNAQRPIIGTVARLSPEKDQQTMITAFGLVAGEFPQARLVFAGDGPSANELREAVAVLHLSEKVDFLGMRTDIATALNQFSIFTLSSTTEGISMTILEAMACGVPIVATDVGGNREVVNPPECGLIVPPRDPRALADAYLSLIRDPIRHAQMGQAARARALSHFSLEKMVGEYARLYTEILRAKHVDHR